MVVKPRRMPKVEFRTSKYRPWQRLRVRAFAMSGARSLIERVAFSVTASMDIEKAVAMFEKPGAYELRVRLGKFEGIIRGAYLVSVEKKRGTGIVVFEAECRGLAMDLLRRQGQ